MRETTIPIAGLNQNVHAESINDASVLTNTGIISKPPKPHLYLSIFTVWLASLFWFGPRLIGLLDMAYSGPSFITMALFILFIGFAWLYGFYNVGIMIFVFIYKYFSKKPEKELVQLTLTEQPPVAILYTTCNDFVEASVLSCVQQYYSNF